MQLDILTAARRIVALLETSGYVDGDSADALRLIAAVQRADLAELHQAREQLAAELEALRNAPPALPLPAAPAPTELTVASTSGTKRRFRAKQDPASACLTCSECGKTGFKNAAGLAGHRAKLHKTSPAPDPLPTLRLVADDLPFVCSVCHSDAFTRDLHQSDRCVRCAKGGSHAA